MRTEKIRKITFTALMTAIALVLSIVEGMLPTAYFMPPGSKMGLSNIPVMFSASSMSIGDTLFIVLAKSIFVLLTRGFTAFAMSLAGGLLSALCMLLMFRRFQGFGCVGIGILSALCHNLGQLAVSFLLVQTSAVLGYAPVLLLSSVVTGFLTGTLLRFAMPYFSKIKEMEK